MADQFVTRSITDVLQMFPTGTPAREAGDARADLTRTATIRVSTRALDIMGLDDPARFTDVERHQFNGRLTACTGRMSALVDLVTELNDRATEGADGYNHPASDKRILRREVAAIRKAYGIEPRP